MKKLKKHILIFLLVFIVVFLLLSEMSTHNIQEQPARFMKVADYADCQIYVDLQTGVEYVGRGNTLAPLFNSYGAPLIYHGFDAREDRLEKGFGGSISPEKQSVLQHRRCLIKTRHARDRAPASTNHELGNAAA